MAKNRSKLIIYQHTTCTILKYRAKPAIDFQFNACYHVIDNGKDNGNDNR